MAKSPENTEGPAPRPHHEKTDDEYVRTGRTEIVIGVVLIVAAIAGYMIYKKSGGGGGVMKDGVVYIVHQEAADAAHKYIRPPKGTECKIVEEKTVKGNLKQLKIEVRLIEGKLEPGEYKVIVVGSDDKQSEYLFAVKDEQAVGDK